RMSTNRPAPGCDRRAFLQAGAASLSTLALARLPAEAAPLPRAQPNPPPAKKPTQFQVARMTPPYSRFPPPRALEGLRQAGYRYVAWGTNHAEGGKRVPVLAADAPPARARDLAARCRDMGLEPLMMFSEVYPEAKNALEVLRNRIRQAAAGRVPQV